MDVEVFTYKDYKKFLNAVVGPRSKRSGIKSAFAKALNCQPTYISQVLYGSAEISLEQADAISEFLAHTVDEHEYFLLLVQKARSGTQKLTSYFSDKCEKFLKKRMVLTERLGKKEYLSEEQISIYYSSWQYAAVHMAITISNVKTVEQISSFTHLSRKRIAEILKFLVQSDLAIKSGDRFKVGKNEIRLGKESHNIIKHHTNWRNRAVHSLESEGLDELHYSAVVTLSKKDAIEIKDKSLKFIKTLVDTIKPSKPEKLRCFTIDFFDVASE